MDSGDALPQNIIRTAYIIMEYGTVNERAEDAD